MTHSPGERRSRHVSVRLTPTEYARLDAAARAAAVELSAHIRKSPLNAPVPKRAKHRSVDHAALGRAVAALNHVGSNINQIARAANATGNLKAYVAAEQERTVMVKAVEAVVKAIENLA